MSFPGSLLPHRVPEQVASQGPMIALQDRILQYLLLGSFLLGAIGCGSMIPAAIQTRNWQSIALPVLLLCAVAAIASLRKLSLQARAGLFLAVLYMLDAQFLLHTGLSAETIVFLFALLFYAGLFFGWELSAVCLALWLAAGVTSLFTPGRTGAFFSLPSQAAMNVLGWYVALVSMVSVGVSTIAAHLLIIREYQKTVKSEQEATNELDQARGTVEQRLEERTLYFQRRLLEARVAADISQTIVSILDPHDLLQQVADLILDRFKLYYVGVFELDAEHRYAALKAGTGDAGQIMLAAGHRLPVGGSSMIGWATLNKQARIALDVGAEAVRFNNPNLPYTRSEIALPIMSKGNVLGALSAQSTQPNAFDGDDIAILQGIANSLGAALENARLYQQTQRTLDEIRNLNRDYLLQEWTDTSSEFGGLSFDFNNPGAANTTAPVSPHEFPLMLRDQIIGYVSLDTDRPELTQEEAAFVDAVTSQTAIALENARLLQETRRHAQEEQKLNEMTEKFSQATTIEDILKSAVKELGGLPSVAEVSIYLVPPEAESPSHGHNGHSHEKQEEL